MTPFHCNKNPFICFIYYYAEVSHNFPFKLNCICLSSIMHMKYILYRNNAFNFSKSSPCDSMDKISTDSIFSLKHLTLFSHCHTQNTQAQLKNTLNIHAVLQDGFFLPGRARGGYVSNCIIWSGTCHSLVSSFIYLIEILTS